jgi:hypothetical protein
MGGVWLDIINILKIKSARKKNNLVYFFIYRKIKFKFKKY